MSTLRRRYKGPTKAKACEILIPVMGSTLPAKCGDRVFRAGRCIEHYNDWRNSRESRQGTEAVNPRRRAKNGTPLPKDLRLATVPHPYVTPKEVEPEFIDERRTRQGVSQSTQDWLIDRAALRRARKSGIVLSDPPTRRQLARFRKVRT